MCQVLDSINGSPKSAASLPLVCNNASAGGRKLLEVLTDLASSAAFRQVHVSRQENIAAAAMNYIHQRGNQTVYESELCSTCGVRERALQKAFKVLLHVSPMRYLKLRRLHAARDALLNASEQWSVKRAALEAGFRDLGRFAADYSRVFGESPSATLKGLRAPRDRKPRPTGQRILHSGLR
jgi:AraC-like DNA-binding protein